MNRYRLLFSIILLLFLSPCLRAGEWQWSVTLDGFVSNETNRNPTAFLWIPADCMQVKAKKLFLIIPFSAKRCRSWESALYG